MIFKGLRRGCRSRGTLFGSIVFFCHLRVDLHIMLHGVVIDMRLRLFKKRYLFLSARTRKKTAIVFYMAAAAAVMIMLACLFFNRIYPNFINRMSIYGHNYAVKLINSSRSEIAEKSSAEEFSNIAANSDGRIVSVESNTMSMNLFKARLIDALQSRLENSDTGVLEIPIGSLLSREVFAAYGPRIKIKVIPGGIAEADFSAEFVSCGINQVKHKIYLNVSLTVSFISATMNNSQTVTTKVPVSETLVSGDVPRYYGGSAAAAAADNMAFGE